MLFVNLLGAPLSLPANGWAGQGQLKNKWRRFCETKTKTQSPKKENRKSKPAFRRSAKAELTKQKIFFSFLKKIGRAQNLKKCRENFSVLDANFFKVCGRKRAGVLKVRIGIFRKKSSNFVQKAPQFFKIKIEVDCSLAPPGAELGFSQDFPSVFEIKIQSLLGNSEVRLSEAQNKTKFCKPIFFSAVGGNVKR